jgi:hypothetical protein
MWSRCGSLFLDSPEAPYERRGSVRRPSSHRIPPRVCRREQACAGRSAERQSPGSNLGFPYRPPAGREIQNRQCHRDGLGLKTSCSPFFDQVYRRVSLQTSDGLRRRLWRSPAELLGETVKALGTSDFGTGERSAHVTLNGPLQPMERRLHSSST